MCCWPGGTQPTTAPFEHRVYQPNPPLLAISKQLLQWTEDDAICMSVWLPPTLSAEHNLLFMLIVYTCDYEVEHCVCVCVCIYVCMCVCAPVSVSACLFYAFAEERQWVHVDKTSSLFGRARQSTHLQKCIVVHLTKSQGGEAGRYTHSTHC